MTREGIITCLETVGVPGDAERWIADDDYRNPSREWLETVFIPAWLKVAAALGIDYAPESQDCDDFADICTDYAKWLHARTPGHGKAGLAFGAFWYHPPARVTGHAICVAIPARDVWTPEPVWMEPQPATCRLFVPTREEIATCERYRI